MCVCETIENSQNRAKSAQKGAWFRSHFSKIAIFSDFSLKSMYLCMNVCMYVCCMNACVYIWVYVCMYEDLRGNLAKIPEKLGKNRTKIEKNRNFWDFWEFCGISSWYMCMYVCMYVCMCVVCMHACMYVRMYAWKWWKFWLKMLKIAKNPKNLGFFGDFCGYLAKICVCMDVCVYVCEYVCIHVCEFRGIFG